MLIRFLQFMSAFLLVKSVNFFCNSFSTQSLKAIVEVSIKCQHFATFWQILYIEIKTRLSQSLKAIVEVLIKCQHLAAADVSTAPRTTINHFRELGIRKSF